MNYVCNKITTILLSLFYEFFALNSVLISVNLNIFKFQYPLSITLNRMKQEEVPFSEMGTHKNRLGFFSAQQAIRESTQRFIDLIIQHKPE